MGYPTAPEVVSYLGSNGLTVKLTDVADALVAEIAAQSRVCRVAPATLEPDLAQALKRRVGRNLAMRNLILGVLSDEAGGIRLGSNDPEIRRLEAPFRKLVQG
jgi:hypothetical protein